MDFDALLDRFAELVAEKVAAKVQGTRNGNGHVSEQPDMLLTAREAATRLNVKPAWLYARARSLPFVVRLPDSRAVRFSARGLEKWLAKRGTQ